MSTGVIASYSDNWPTFLGDPSLCALCGILNVMLFLKNWEISLLNMFYLLAMKVDIPQPAGHRLRFRS